VFHLQTDYA